MSTALGVPTDEPLQLDPLSVVHDLRNGFVTLSLSVDSLKNHVRESHSQAVLTRIEKQVLNQKQLLQSLAETLSTRARRAGGDTITLKALSALLAELVSELHAVHDFESIELHAASDEFAAPVFASWKLLRQALENAVDDAARANATRCRIRVENRPASVLIEIQDNGAGIRPDQLSGISWGFSTRGSGIGAQTIRRNLCRMRGAARWLPAPGGGTLLELELEKAN